MSVYKVKTYAPWVPYLFTLANLRIVGVDSGDGVPEDLSVEGDGVGGGVDQWRGHLH